MEVYNVFQEIQPDLEDLLILTQTSQQFNYIKSLKIIRKYRLAKLGKWGLTRRGLRRNECQHFGDYFEKGRC